jgi:Glyoxalase-like domain
MPELDHVFICCSLGAPEAAALLGLGLTEGSSNSHPGQGTACRRFFFKNAYLELFWVRDPQEAQSPSASPTRLWDRWSRRGAPACPFGLVFRAQADERDPTPPFATWSYRPSYLPPDIAIEVASGTPLTEPGLFYFRFARSPDALQREPTRHALPLRELTDVTISLPTAGPLSPAAQAVESSGLVSFSGADTHLLNLAFDGATRSESRDLRPALPLVLRW